MSKNNVWIFKNVYHQATAETAEAIAYLKNKQAKINGKFSRNQDMSGSVDVELPVRDYERMGAAFQVGLKNFI